MKIGSRAIKDEFLPQFRCGDSGTLHKLAALSMPSKMPSFRSSAKTFPAHEPGRRRGAR